MFDKCPFASRNRFNTPLNRYIRSLWSTGPSTSNLQPAIFSSPYHQGRDVMSFEGLPRGTVVELYTADGRQLSSQKTSGDATTEISLTDQPAGTYYVKIGDAQYKFEKR